MTFDDVLIVGTGTLVLLGVFLVAGMLMRGGIPDVWGVVRRYVAVKIADADDIRIGATGDATEAGVVVRGQQHQAAAEFDSENASEREALTLRQLAKTELIVLLAVQRKDDGGYVWSSNEIKKFVPGADGPIGEVIATVRGKKETPPAGAPLRRPVNGW